MDNLDKKIQKLLSLSGAPDILKNLIKSSLGLFSNDQKEQLLTTLISEQKKLASLSQKEERIKQKYSVMTEKFGKKVK